MHFVYETPQIAFSNSAAASPICVCAANTASRLRYALPACLSAGMREHTRNFFCSECARSSVASCRIDAQAKILGVETRIARGNPRKIAQAYARRRIGGVRIAGAAAVWLAIGGAQKKSRRIRLWRIADFPRRRMRAAASAACA